MYQKIHLHKQTGLRWRTYRYIEGIIQDMNNYPVLIKNRENEIIAPFKAQDENIGGGRSSLISNATERVAIALASDDILNLLEKEYTAVSESLDELCDEHKKVIQLAYLIKPRTKTWQGIAMECNYSTKHCYHIRDKLILKIAEKIGMR